MRTVVVFTDGKDERHTTADKLNSSTTFARSPRLPAVKRSLTLHE